jgi:hypothetical protein
VRSERTIEFARQFLDPQLLVSYQGLIIRGLGSGHREFRFGVCGPGRFDDVPVARRGQRRLQRSDVIWKGFTTRIHVRIESQIGGRLAKNNVSELSGTFRAKATTRIAPIDSVEHVTARPRFQPHHRQERAR